MLKRLISKKSLVILTLFLVGLMVRIKFAQILPITNDEGAYLYDTLNIRNGLIPLGNFLTKSIPFIYLLTLSQYLFGNSLIVGRMLVILIAMLSSLFLFLLTKELFGKRVGYVAAAIYWIFPLIAAYTSLIHTEPLQTLLTLASYYLFLIYLKNAKSRKLLILVFSALLISISFFVRQSTLVTIGWPFLLGVLNYSKNKDTVMMKAAFLYGLITALFIFLAAVLSFNILGYEKTLEFVGMGAVDLTLSEKTSLTTKGLILYPAKYIWEFSLEASNLYRDGQIILVFGLIYFYFYKIKTKATSTLGSIGINAYSLSILGLIWLFQSKYNLYTGMWKVDLIPHTILILTSLVLVLSLALENLRFINTPDKKIFNKLSTQFVAGWFGSLTILYMVWIKFRSPYLIEFFPSMIIFASAALVVFYDNLNAGKHTVLTKYTKAAFYVFILISFYGSYTFNRAVYFTGIHGVEDLNLVRNYLTTNSTQQDEILTASAIFPYVSGDRLLYDISHPAWYGYPTIRTETLLLYFPPLSQIVEAVNSQRPKYVIKDPFTDASYLRHNDLSLAVAKNYTLVTTIGRVTIYQRNGDLNGKKETVLEK